MERPIKCECASCRLILADGRIRRALKTLKAAERYDTDDADPDTWLGYRGVAQAVDADIVDQVIQILEGESDGQTE